MAKVTYLIGAGASAGALPVVKNFAEKISDIIGQLTAIGITRSHEYYQEYAKSMSDLNFLLQGCKNHMSVDTFCRMLYLTDRNEEYIKAKQSIILFFDLYRYYNQLQDKRYDAFLATILKKAKPRFPKDVNIISWNYDCEFEKAFLSYNNPRISMENVYGELNVIHKNSKDIAGLNNNFGIIKINGTTGFYKNNRPLLGLDTWETKQSINNGIWLILSAYYKYTVKEMLDPMISFAWDDDYGERKMKDEIAEALSSSTILVIIGYSFPYFNREMDRHIFNSFQTTGHLRRVYIQDKDGRKRQETVDIFKRSNQMSTHIIDDLDQFYIPHELD